MPNMVFDSQSIYQGNVQKYEEKLTNPMMKFNDKGMILVTWWQINDDKSVYDEGLGQSDELLGPNSGRRYNKVKHLGVCLMNETDVNVEEEIPGVFDITHEGSLQVFPKTIVPNPDTDFFVIEHLQMRAIFRCTGVDYDHMRVNGYYKCEYKLENTDMETLADLENQTVATFVMKHDDFGTDVSPIIREDHYEYMQKLEYVYNDMVGLYMSMFYNRRHDCLLWYNINVNKSMFDECLQHFISSHSLLSIKNSNQIVMLERKLDDPRFDMLYNRSMWRWIERDAPSNLVEKFGYNVSGVHGYIDSSFHDWGEQSFYCIWPAIGNNVSNKGTYFDNRMHSILDGGLKPQSSYEKVLRLFVSGELKSVEQIPLDLYQDLLDGGNDFHLFVYTPIIMYIIRKAMLFR